jgi:hypothetical protein
MKDTDWRPSPCPACGEMREAARNPVCRNVDCVNDVAKSRMPDAPRYVWIRANGDATIISDPVKLWQDPCFNRVEDRIYTLGNEVEVKVTVEVKNKPVYRGNTTDNVTGYRVPFENRD